MNLHEHQDIIDSRSSKKQKLLESPKNSPTRQSEAANVNNFTALSNLDLKILKGEFVCIIGDVGSGKSSLLSSLIGDLLYLPQNFKDVHGQELITNPEIKVEIAKDS